MTNNLEDKTFLTKNEYIISQLFSIHLMRGSEIQRVFNTQIALINIIKVKLIERIIQLFKKLLLTPMESYVLSLLLQEKDLCYIAEISTLSVKTINAHKRPIMKKVHVKK
ncbi:helix-turn-helix transcriptional regulator [Buttiauxella sp. W03-F01]|uniref:helix-turn-helix transcriptional regulator n=1 Tax=Buttiauxella sp. W03-F01 TaxID=2904524 RepID=UPI00351D1681